ncbi:hypothetical protein ACGFYZ_03700 [Streptomyces sp. NPDC048330]|uniref:hypothetical protein n=1 Tax=Streptomyces sp. NPDC048330 TaxID=3365533 RepID=UPI00371ED597
MVRGVRGKWCGTLLLAAALAVGGASGCGPEVPPAPGGPPSGPTAPSAPPAGTPSTTTTPASPSQDTPSAEVLVEVVVNGGLAGVRNRLVVHDDGTWTVRSGTRPPRTGRQTPAETAALKAALEDPAYARVPERPAGGPIADGFQYYVTYRHRLVVADDGDRPEALRRVFAALPEGGPPTSP